MNKNPTFLHNIITSDDTWCFLYNPRPSLSWLGENHHYATGKLNVYRKVMLETFFDSRNIIHKEFIPVAVTITKEWYAQELRSLWEAIHQKQTDMWMLIPGCLPHSPDITPCDIFFCLHSWRKYYTAAISKCRGYHGHDTWQKEMHFSTTSKTSMPTGRDALKWIETNLKQFLLNGKPCPQIITHDSSSIWNLDCQHIWMTVNVNDSC